MRYFNVFEVSQTTLIPKRTLEEKKDNKLDIDVEKFVTDFAKATELKITQIHSANKTACYIPSKHAIEISEISLYKSSNEYYSTLFHEMIHSTMKDLNRKTSCSFGSELYSKEEVVAEVGAMFLCDMFGIERTSSNSIAYVQSWSKHLRDNPDWLISGANQSEKAVDFMLEKAGIKLDKQEEIEENIA